MVVANYLILKSKMFRDLVEGREIVFVQHGKVMEDNLKEARMTPEDFLECFEQNVFQVADVEFAVDGIGWGSECVYKMKFETDHAFRFLDGP